MASITMVARHRSSKKRSRAGFLPKKGSENPVQTRRLPSSSLLYSFRYTSGGKVEAEEGVEEWVEYSVRETDDRPKDTGEKRKIMEFRTTKAMVLLLLAKRPDSKSRGRMMDMEAKDSKKAVGETPTKDVRDVQGDRIRNLIESENLDGWVFGNTVCLRGNENIILIDDDKRSGLSQQLLTDMLMKLKMSK